MTSTTTRTTTLRNTAALHLSMSLKPGTPVPEAQVSIARDVLEFAGLESQRSTDGAQHIGPQATISAANAALHDLQASSDKLRCTSPAQLRRALKTHPFAESVKLVPATADAFADADLALLRRFSALKSLSIEGRFAISNATARALAELDGLESLTLDSAHTRTARLDDDGMRELAELRRLRAFSAFGFTRISDAAFSHLPALRSLKLGAVDRVTGSGFSQMRRLESLDVSACDGISDAGLTSLGDLHASLRHVAITFCKGMTAESMPALKRLLHVRTLNLHGSEHCRPDLKEFEELAGSGELRRLNLYSAIQTHVGSPAANLRKLERLDVRYAPGIPSPYAVNIGYGSSAQKNPPIELRLPPIPVRPAASARIGVTDVNGTAAGEAQAAIRALLIQHRR